ncbi:aminoglycoside phosphotransferase [Paenibacillus sp. J31TS4]|uniref:phosphotransferase n=1 Tax=Paenibacillus sp. J31TS4 TaxID=2807195 RepID=UPI001B2080C0|nr:phosphotransferase [Paenibacillus sp. J31TS4]GIP39077.1 aminoglycoside phosphotransferase [Paenibacillus sp. J31TS4]
MAANHDPVPALRELCERGILPPHSRVVKRLSGTTSGAVFLLEAEGEPGLVLKMDAPEELRSVISFLDAYQGELLAGVRYADPGCRYYLYEFIEGTSGEGRGRKADWLKTLASGLLSRYVPAAEPSIWGEVVRPSPSWLAFLKGELRENRRTIGGVLSEEEHTAAQRALAASSYAHDSEPPYLLHGDCGAHNFLFREGVLTGVIDPYPVAGPPVYDLLYAFCSTPDDLTPAALADAVSILSAKQPLPARASGLTAEVLVHLYNRIGICMRHHPQDLSRYLAAWEEWRARGSF